MSFLAFCYATTTDEFSSMAVSQFPLDSIPDAVALWVSCFSVLEQFKRRIQQNTLPSLSTEELIELYYPYHMTLKKEGSDVVRDAMDSFTVRNKGEGAGASVSSEGAVTVKCGGDEVCIDNVKPLERVSGYVNNSSHDTALALMLTQHTKVSLSRGL